MRTSKLTATMLFVASMAWASNVNAEEPCGAPADSFNSCEVVQAPDCYDLCEPEAMVVACVAENVDQCMAECAGPGSIACDSTCEQECGNTCAAAMVDEEPDCKISCGASCMGECGAGCEVSDDKTGCFAACGQQCSAHCELSCDGGALYIDSGNDSIQENWNRDDDDDHRGRRDDDDDHRKKWRDDDDDHRKKWRDDDDDHNKQAPASEGLDYDQGLAEKRGDGPEDCAISCGASCMGECGAGCEVSDDKASCFAACGQQCGASCELSCDGDGLLTDGLGYDQGLAEKKGDGPEDCAISCGSSCMGECGAGCEVSDDKASCFAACGQQCSASCELSCDGAPDIIDSGTDSYQENWNRDDDDDHRGHRDDDDDHRKKWRDDDDDHRKKWRDDDDDHNAQGPASDGLDYDQGAQESQQAGPDDITNECQLTCQQSCGGACEAGDARACELGCQADALTVCKPQMTSACTDQCGRGALLLCDGQYLKVDDVGACVAALEQVGVPIEGPLAAFDGGEVLADALEGASCSVEEPKNLRFAGGLFALLGLGLGASFLRRRRS